MWILALRYVTHVLNHTATESINWRTPLEKLSGSTPGISSMLLFQFWEKIYYKHDIPSFPSESTERIVRFVGIADHVGHALTIKVLTEDTNKSPLDQGSDQSMIVPSTTTVLIQIYLKL